MTSVLGTGDSVIYLRCILNDGHLIQKWYLTSILNVHPVRQEDYWPNMQMLYRLSYRAHVWSAVAQSVECQTRNRESPGSNPRCYRFEVWAFSFTSRRLSRLSCINEYLAIDSGGNVSE